jgi:hypothetical protein
VGVTTPDVMGTVFGLLTSVVAVPIKKLFSENLDPDGRDVCMAAMAWVNDVSNRGESRGRAANRPIERRAVAPDVDRKGVAPAPDAQARDSKDAWWGGDRQH